MHERISYSLDRDIVDLQKAVVALCDGLSEMPDPQGFVLAIVKEFSNPEIPDSQGFVPAIVKELSSLRDTLSQIAERHIDLDEEKKHDLHEILKSCETSVDIILQLVLKWKFRQENNKNREFRTGVDMKDLMEVIHAIMTKPTTRINRLFETIQTETELLEISKRDRTSHFNSEVTCVTCNDTWTPPSDVDLSLPGKRATTSDGMTEDNALFGVGDQLESTPLKSTARARKRPRSWKPKKLPLVIHQDLPGLVSSREDETIHLESFRNFNMANKQAGFESLKQRHRHNETNNDPLLSPRTTSNQDIASHHASEHQVATDSSNVNFEIPFAQDWLVTEQLILLLREDEILKTLPIRAQEKSAGFQMRMEYRVKKAFRIFGDDLRQEASNRIQHWVTRVVRRKAEKVAYAFIKNSPEDITRIRLTSDYESISERSLRYRKPDSKNYDAISPEEITVPLRGLSLMFMVNSQAFLRLRDFLYDLALPLFLESQITQKNMLVEASSTSYSTGIMALVDQKRLATLEIPWKSPSPVSEDQEAYFIDLDILRDFHYEASELLAFMSLLGSPAISERWFPSLNGSRDTQAIEVIVALGLATRDAEESSVYSMRSSTQSLTRMWLKARGLFYKTRLSSLRHICKMSRYLNRRAKERILVSLSHAELWAKRVPTVTVKGKFRMHALCMLLLNTDQILSARSSLSKARRRVERSYRYLVHYSPEIDPRRFGEEVLLALHHHQVGQMMPSLFMERIATGAIISVFSSPNLPLLPFPESTGLIRLILAFFSWLHTRRSGLSRPTRIREQDRMSITIPIESMFSGTTLKVDMMDDFVNCFTDTLINDGFILSLLKTIIARRRMPRSKTQNNLRKLLNSLAKDLQQESSAREIRALEKFIANHSLYISTSILNIIDGGKTISGLPSTPLDSKEKAIAFLESYVVSGLPHTAAEEMPTVEMEDSNDDLYEDIHDALEDRILSDDLTKQLSGVMESLRDLFSQSLAYHNFRLRIYSLAYPTVSSRALGLIERWSSPQDPNNPLVSRYRLKELVTSLENVQPEDLRVEEPLSSTRCSISYYQRKVETFTKSSWDWWPLPPPVQPTKEGESRLTWKCTCGETRYAVIPNQFSERLQIYAAATTPPLIPPPPMAHIPQSHQSKPSTSSGGRTTGSSQSAPTSQHTPMLNVQGISKISSSRQFDSMRIILMVKRGDDYRLSQIGLQQLDCHGFFSILRREYFNLRGFVRGWFSVWRYSHCDFYTCEKFSERYFTPKKKDSFPIPANDDYDYDKPLKSIPPIQDHEFRVRFYACHKPNPIRHFWHKCKKLGGHSNDVLGLFPKKKTELEEAGDKREEFWGVFARERPSLRWILIYNFLCLAPMLGFFISRAIQLPSDLQNPAVPFTFMIGTLSMFWSIFLGTHDFGRSI